LDRERIISEGYRAFSNFARPEHFTNHTHCEERAEHDETMPSCSLSEIGPQHVGNPGWSPIPFLTESAYGYVMPRLLEMALSNGTNSDSDPFLFQYLLALTPAPEHKRLDYFTSEQANVILESLYYIRDRMGPLVERECCESDLSKAIALWQTIAPNGSLNRTPNGAD